MVEAQQETPFAEETPLPVTQSSYEVAVTVHVAGLAADIHNGADPATVENVLRLLKLC